MMDIAGGSDNSSSERRSRKTPGKQFRLRADQIKPLVPGCGYCLATDLITVHGHHVGYMYREDPTSGGDSGWRFQAGVETEEYLDDPANWAIYAVNTIANYDPEIIPFLRAPIGSEYERDALTGKLVEVNDIER